MLSSMFKNLATSFQSLCRINGTRRRRQTTKNLQTDQLESRLLMTVQVWDGGGGGANNGFSNRFNWAGDVAPTTNDQLVFPTSAPVRNVNNDLSVTFNSITFSGSGAGGYQIKGNPLKLSGNIVVDPVAGTQHDIETSINFFGATVHTISAGAGSVLNLNRAVSSSNQVVTLTKAGDGRLVLAGNNTFGAKFVVQAGIVQLGSATALGATTGSTTVNPGAAIHLEELLLGSEEFPRNLTIAEPLVLIGTGINNTGALRNVSGDNHWTGPISLGGGIGNTIGVEGDNGEFFKDELTISGVVSDTAAAGFSKRGVGRLNLTAANTYRAATNIEQGIVRIQDSLSLGSPVGITTVQTGAALELDEIEIGGNETLTLNVAEPLRLSGTGVGNTGALRNVDGSNQWLGPITMLAASSINVDQIGDVLSIPAVISGASRVGLQTTGPGEIVLSGNNTYSGTTTVVSGTLQVNGLQPSSPILVNGGLLTGTGTVGATIIQGAGAINPAGNSTGTFHVNGGFVAKGQIRINVSGATNDKIVVKGKVDLTNAPIIVSGNSTASKFAIIDNDLTDGVAGTTNATTITSSTGQQFKVSYTTGTGNDVFLVRQNTPPMFTQRTVTPEVTEGTSVVVSGTIVEPDTLDKFFMNIVWGDGETSRHIFRPGTPRSVEIPHEYAQDGHYTIQLKWTDESGQGNTGTLAAVVNNVAPSISAGSTTTIHANQLFLRRLQFEDPGHDAWLATIDFGDGSAPKTVDLGHSRSLRLRHRFAQPGVYRVNIQIQDHDGGNGSDSVFVIVT